MNGKFKRTEFNLKSFLLQYKSLYCDFDEFKPSLKG